MTTFIKLFTGSSSEKKTTFSYRSSSFISRQRSTDVQRLTTSSMKPVRHQKDSTSFWVMNRMGDRRSLIPWT